ncbi:LutC/YkgG family protein [Halorientalis regularis]|jgi:L-lactate dehydrogenase complex protein LldG|uniref:L-lactate dehydrogenase complex protein LldG n=1 Tax=Halorientalis regularis TaxID=660518 RepID=A0A1G7S6C3_9EURY|nr:LUD domain-containing protein [Halorientalis regularis]SDG18543.1 L-lactate dehydrogenase complex protein LldG [Halorientalis regularis]
MSSESLSTFESSVPGPVHRTTAADADATLSEAIEEPAVGTALPYDEVSLADAVDTDPSPSALETAATGVTPAALGIADYGTVTIPSGAAGDELVSLYTPRHVAVVAASDIVPDMPTAYERLGEDFAAGMDTQILATGPSATADMGTLVQGVHGPSETHVVVLEDR